MDANQKAYLYMLSWVRLHSKSDPGAWTPEQIYQCFMLLEPPPVAANEWAAKLYPEPLPGVPVSGSFAEVLKAIHPEPKVEEKKEPAT